MAKAAGLVMGDRITYLFAPSETGTNKGTVFPVVEWELHIKSGGVSPLALVCFTLPFHGSIAR
jgi:hypothetical protein